MAKFLNTSATNYYNERAAIITSLNLYDFSQVNNNEMGVYVDREQESELYHETYEEAQRLIRISDEVRLAADKVDPAGVKEPDSPAPTATNAADNGYAKLTTSKLAKALGMRTGQLNEQLLATGLLERDGDMFKLTDKGKAVGGEFRVSKQFGPFFLWPAELRP